MVFKTGIAHNAMANGERASLYKGISHNVQANSPEVLYSAFWAWPVMRWPVFLT
jgi:hypothetical protein